MSSKSELTSLAAAISAALAASAFTIPNASADENPFTITDLSARYMVAGKEGSCGEGKCGEGKCGGDDKGEHMNKDTTVNYTY